MKKIILAIVLLLFTVSNIESQEEKEIKIYKNENISFSSILTSSDRIKISKLESSRFFHFIQNGNEIKVIDISEIDSIIFLPKAEIYAVDISAETDWSYMLVGNDGSSAFVSLNENTNIPTHLFFRPDRNSDAGYTLFFRENGLPEIVVIDDYIIYMDNFSETKFDMALIYPNDSISYFYDIHSSINWRSYPDNSEAIRSMLRNDNLSRSLLFVGDAMGEIACAVGLIEASSGNSLSKAIALAGCGTTLAGVMSDDFEKKVFWTTAGTVITIIGCYNSVGLSCILSATASAIDMFNLGSEELRKYLDKIFEAAQILENNASRESYLIKFENSDIIEIPFPQTIGYIGVSTRSEWKIEEEDKGWCIARKSNQNKDIFPNQWIEIEIKAQYPDPVLLGGTGLLDGSREVTFRVCPTHRAVPCASFTVIQTGLKYTIEPRELNFTAAGEAIGGKDELIISIPFSGYASVKNVEVKYKNDDEEKWCNYSINTVMENTFVKVNVTPNKGKERYVEIEVTFNLGEHSEHTTFVVVNQAGVEETKDYLTLSQDKFYYEKEGGWDKFFTINTNLKVTEIFVANILSNKENEKWCRVDYDKDNPKDVYIIVDPNKTISPCQATITVEAINPITYEPKLQFVDVYQEAGEAQDEEAQIRAYLENLYHDTDGDNWIRNDYWLTDAPIYNWYGVSYAPGKTFSLSLRNNNLKGYIDLSGCTYLSWLSCGNNPIVGNENSITSINVSGCTNLDYLECPWINSLTTINASGCSSLTRIWCIYSQVISLDVSNCTKLDDLECAFNQLRNLNISGCTNLAILACDNNQLTSLNVSGCTNLWFLGCTYNQLNSLSVNGCTNLRELHCNHNKILSEIPAWFSQLNNFIHDNRYSYYWEWEWKYSDNGVGWWYPGEPEKGYHGQ